MNRCRDCKWWGPTKGPCEGFRMLIARPDCSTCECPKLTKGDGTYYYDGESIGAKEKPVNGDRFHVDYPVADLVTGPDFVGCVHWEAKEE